MSEERFAELRYQRNERLLVAAYLLCVMVLQAHFVHDGWFGLLHPAVVYRGPVSLVLFAPDIYRVGMQLVSHAIESVVPDPAARLTLIDFLFGYAALYALYLLQASRAPLRMLDRACRVVTLALFLAVIHFPLLWVVPYQRPETMPMTLYLAVAILLLLRVRSGLAWAMGLLALTIVAAFLRSDVPCIFGVAVFLLGMCGNVLSEIAPRRTCIVLGGCIAAAAAAVQGYLQLIRFPHAIYPPGVPLVMFHYNARAHSLAMLSIALLPVLLTGVASVLVRARMRSVDWLCITAAAIYLPLWCTVGSTAEVRIYVPFLLLLCPVAARILAAVLGFHDSLRRP